MNNKGKRILLVEDNEKIMYGNKKMFQWEGYETDAAATLSEARVLIGKCKPDVIVLDIMLPDGSGLNFMRELRKSKNAGVPILLLTGLTTKEDVVRGLKAGGDDYLTKPYDFPVLFAWVEALLRRAVRVPEVIKKGRLSLDVTAVVALLDETDLLLAQKEFALLLIFVQNEGRIISADYLYEKVWKSPMANDSNTLKTTINRLRSKIKDCGYHIVNSKNEGYSFEEE
jgi:DNA-binding response OmpR family regulator